VLKEKRKSQAMEIYAVLAIDITPSTDLYILRMMQDGDWILTWDKTIVDGDPEVLP
jgi:hypothetical protein